MSGASRELVSQMSFADGIGIIGAALIVGTDGRRAARMIPSIGEQFGTDRHNWFLTQIPVHALFIFPNNPSVDLAEGLAINAALINELEIEDAALEAQRRIQVNAIKRDSPHATVVELEHTAQRNFMRRCDRVIEEMRRFLR